MEIETNKIEKEEGQFVKITFTKTGEDKKGMPGEISIKINQLTQAQIIIAATALMRKAYNECETDNGLDITDVLANAFSAKKQVNEIIDAIKTGLEKNTKENEDGNETCIQSDK